MQSNLQGHYLYLELYAKESQGHYLYLELYAFWRAITFTLNFMLFGIIAQNDSTRHFFLALVLQQNREHPKSPIFAGVCYYEINFIDGCFYGIGMHSDTIRASFLAIISAVNRYFLNTEKKSKLGGSESFLKKVRNFWSKFKKKLI